MWLVVFSRAGGRARARERPDPTQCVLVKAWLAPVKWKKEHVGSTTFACLQDFLFLLFLSGFQKEFTSSLSQPALVAFATTACSEALPALHYVAS